MKEQSPKYIVFFDTDCLICNRFIQFVSKHDHQNQVCFANFRDIITSSDSIQVYDTSTDKWYDQSDAVIHLIYNLQGWQRIIILGKIIPKFLRDAMYRLVAKNRLKFKPQKSYCDISLREKVLSKDEVAHFIH